MEYIGISGWTYEPWRGVFYPEGLAQRRELEYASSQFNSIEINGTHYSLQKPESFRKWAAETPGSGFVFSVKGPRYITHMRRLKEVEAPLANFFASGVLALAREGKLGPLLWQLPPSFRFEEKRIDHFLSLLPRDTEEAADLASRHDDHLKAPPWLDAGRKRPLRHAMEVRHGSFMVPEFFEMLRDHRVAFVFADTAGKWPYAEDLTSDFVYIRLHGDEELYVSGYTGEALDRWAARIRRWREGAQPGDARLILPNKPRPPRKIRDVYVYFDNDVKVKAPRDAKALAKRLA
jgi:uncharacterized protein YecE (DUF72 family)